MAREQDDKHSQVAQESEDGDDPSDGTQKTVTQQVLTRVEGIRFWGALKQTVADTQIQIRIVKINIIKIGQIFGWWVPVKMG